MEVPDSVFWTLVGLALAGPVVAWFALRAWRRTRLALREARSAKRSQSVRYGTLTEQFAPWMDGWPFEPSGFRFLGKPIDGVQFTDEAVYLVEIKAAGSRRSPEQTRIRELVREGRVGWIEFRIDKAGATETLEPWRR